jgi:MFS family permease
MAFFTLVQLVVPLIPPYVKTMSGDALVIGFTVASISITAILLRPVSGVVSDRWSRSGLMILGLLLASFAYFALFFTEDILHIVIARLIEGAGVAAFVPSSIASAVDQAPEGKLGETLGWRSLMIGIGFVVGPSVGGPLAYILGSKEIFIISSVLLILLVPLVVSRRKGHRPPRDRDSVSGLKERNFVVAFTGVVIFGLAWWGLYTFFETNLIDAGYAIYEITFWVGIQAVFSLLVRVVAGKAADKRPDTMAYSGLLIMAFGLFVLFLTRVPPYFYAAAPIYGIGAGTYMPGSQTLALVKAPPGNRGYLASIYTMGLDIGALIGPITFGLMLQATNDYSYVFGLAPILMFIASIAIVIPTRAFRRRNNGSL